MLIISLSLPNLGIFFKQLVFKQHIGIFSEATQPERGLAGVAIAENEPPTIYIYYKKWQNII